MGISRDGQRGFGLGGGGGRQSQPVLTGRGCRGGLDLRLPIKPEALQDPTLVWRDSRDLL